MLSNVKQDNEPNLIDIMNDPIIELLIKSDGIKKEDVIAVCKSASKKAA